MVEHQQNRAERLVAALDDFIRSSPDVEAAAVVSFDGLPMASALPDDLEEDRLGAMSAALLSLGEQATLGLGRGQLNQVFVEGEHGFVFLMSAKDQAVLAAVARRSAKIGFMLFEMRRAAERIGRLLVPTAADADGHAAMPLTPVTPHRWPRRPRHPPARTARPASTSSSRPETRPGAARRSSCWRDAWETSRSPTSCGCSRSPPRAAGCGSPMRAPRPASGCSRAASATPRPTPAGSGSPAACSARS
jgi:uncharacterized protein